MFVSVLIQTVTDELGEQLLSDNTRMTAKIGAISTKLHSLEEDPDFSFLRMGSEVSLVERVSASSCMPSKKVAHARGLHR